MSSIKNEIKSIYIKNIKGYDNVGKTLSFNNNGQGLLANKLNILIAPNGFGKSSLTVALNSTSNGRRIHLNKKEYFKENDLLNPEIKIKCKLNDEEKELIANNSSNDINKIFDIFVINSNLDTKGIRGHFRGANSDLIIKDIELMKIPEVISSLEYEISEIKSFLDEKGFGKLNKRDIYEYINYLIKIDEIDDFINSLKKYSKKRAYKKLLENPIECDGIDIKDINYFIAILEIYKKDKNRFIKYVKYKIYKFKYKVAEKILNDIKTFDNFELKLKKDGDRLLVKIPKATLISNGQRDVLVFLANLLKLEFNFITSNKNYGILIIDEVFDYLDDANLLIAQFYLVNLIQKISKTHKKLFTILLTHLAPNNFNHFYFNRKKLKKVFYLTQEPTLNEEIVKFIRIREQIKSRSDRIYDIMSKFLHFTKDNINLPEVEGLEVSFNDKKCFIEIINDEYKKYYKESDYCPFSVAIFLRIYVEEKVYSMLPDGLREKYLNENTTINKLDFAKEKGIEVDERYYLLSAIYNEMSHNPKGILYFKLNNKIIMNLIISVIGEQ